MKLGNVVRSVAGGRFRISATLELDTQGRVFKATGTPVIELWFDWREDYYCPDTVHIDPFVLVCLPLAMSLGEPLKVEGSVSQDLLVNLLEVMAVYKTFFPKTCDVIDVRAQGVARPLIDTTRVGSFFSGGVDSLYNIAEMRRLNKVYGSRSVTDLWLVQGMDIALDQDALWEETKARIFDQVRPEDGLRFVDVRTNARQVHDRYVDWRDLGFSCILGGIAKCFAPIVSSALIGSYARYADLIPHCSSPMVDPLWSWDKQRIRHFSCRVDRQEKIDTVVSETPHLLEGLRVCYKNTKGTYNCGVCEKCMRTQAQLLIGGYQSLVNTFDQPLTAERLERLKLPWRRAFGSTWSFWREVEQGLRQKGEAELSLGLSRALSRNRRVRFLKRAVRWER